MNGRLLCPYCLGETDLPIEACPHCGKPLTNRNPAGALPFGTSLAGGRYTVADYIAADGEGLSYRGVDNEAGLFLTIKEYFPVTLSSGRTKNGVIRSKPGCEVLYKTIRNDFQDLYVTLQRITPATGLVTVLDVLEGNNTVYAVLESARGVTLSRYLQLHSKKPLSAAESAGLLAPVMEGVAYLHRNGLIHRGICPENILLPIDGGACLTGYATQGLRTAQGELKAKLYAGYAAPEQYSADQFEGFFTDVYGLSAVLYRMNGGKDPTPAPERGQGEELPPLHVLNPSVPQYFSRVVACGLRLNGNTRLQTVEDLATALERREEADAMLGKEPRKRRHAGTSVKLLSVFIVLLVILLLLAVWIVIRLPHSEPASSESVEETPPPPTAAPVETRTVPNFVGQSYEEIRANQEYLSAYRFAITEVYSDTYDEGVVIQQDPAADASVPTGEKTVIQLTVSKGHEELEMPDIIGYSEQDARATLEDAGLQYRIVRDVQNDGENASGSVAYCDYEPGAMVNAKTIVTVYLWGDRLEDLLGIPVEGGEEPPEQETAGEGVIQ